jgi:hypothetical protein
MMDLRDFDNTKQLRIRLYPAEWDAMIRLMHAKGAESPSQLIRDFINGSTLKGNEAHDARNSNR